LRKTSGDAGEDRDSLIAFIKQQDIGLVFIERVASALA
jgi:hypothetical protein